MNNHKLKKAFVSKALKYWEVLTGSETERWIDIAKKNKNKNKYKHYQFPSSRIQ